MQTNLKNIFRVNDKDILDFQSWEKYLEETNFEKGHIAKFYKKNFEGEEISAGVFYKHQMPGTVDYVAWGFRKDKDCSFHAMVRENKYLDKIISGCPCFDEEADSEVGYKKYAPIFTILSVILFLSLLVPFSFGVLNLMSFMSLYMSLFFILFGGLKFINLPAFSNMFAKYDPIAFRYKWYGIMYPYLEIFFGILYLFWPGNLYLNILVVVLLSLTTIGIYRKLKSGGVMSCACLGSGFNVPLSNVTVAENLIMIIMALVMIGM